MNKFEQSRWKSEVLDHLFRAFAAFPDLYEKIIYKGARVLALRLPTQRQSLDIDATMSIDFINDLTDWPSRTQYLDENLSRAIHRYFEGQDPVRFKLAHLSVEFRPHPKGWSAFRIRINVEDAMKVGTRGLPVLEIDISAPESLTRTSYSDLQIDGLMVKAYTLERIAGEKLRAFLTTLPSYRKKMMKPGESVRVKDLYDLTTILRAKPITDIRFWETVAKEFVSACESRFVDCAGLETFQEAWETTRSTYEQESSLPSDVSLKQAETALRTIVEFLSGQGVFPLQFPLTEP